MTSKRAPIDLDLFRPAGATAGGLEAQEEEARPASGVGVPEPKVDGAAGHWDWSGNEVARTHRFPAELIEAFEDRLARLKLPAGLTFAAALATLLDLDDEALEAAVRRAHAARPVKFGRR